MTPQELKNSIFWSAIQGKLTKQNKVESVQQIVPISFMELDVQDDAYFEIPDNWCWCKIGKIFKLVNGKAFKPTDWSEKGLPIVRIQNLNDVNAPYNYFSGNIEDKYVLVGGELLFSWSGTPGTSFGAYIWKGGKAVLNQHIFILYPQIELDYQYAKYALNGELKIFIGKAHGGAGLKHITKKEFEGCLFPVPPLAEQKRIVAKIEELLPYIDRYEQAWSKLEQFNSRFPEDMKKSLLQYAIQGKLVEQRPEEGTAEELYAQIQQEKQQLIAEKKSKKEKPLPEITDDEKPFDIPESWKWVRFGMVIDMLSGYAFKSQDFKQEGNYRLLRGINLGVDTIRWNDTVYLNEISDKLGAYKLTIGDVLLGLDRPWISEGIRVAIFDDLQDTFLVQRVLRIREIGAVTNKYAALILRSALFMNAVAPQTTGISVPHISPTQVGNVAIPLPPLAEQKRIVEKLEQLLPLCERLK